MNLGDLVVRRADRTGPPDPGGPPGLVKLITSNGKLALVDFPGGVTEMIRVDQLVPVVVTSPEALHVFEVALHWARNGGSVESSDLVAAIEAYARATYGPG